MPLVKFAIAPRFRRKSLVSGWKLDYITLIVESYFYCSHMLSYVFSFSMAGNPDFRDNSRIISRKD